MRINSEAVTSDPSNAAAMKEILFLLVPLLIRMLLLWQGSQNWLGRRIEISTPVNQWMRIKEGIALAENGLSPYSGDIFHETPLVLLLFKFLLAAGESVVGLFFVVVDFMVAVCIANIGILHRKEQLSRQAEEQKEHGKGVQDILVKEDKSLPLFMATIYLLNPYSILTCAGFSTASLSTLAVAWAIWMRLRGSEVLSMLGVVLAAYLSLYPIVLICPFILMSYRKCSVPGVVRQVYLVVGWASFLLFLSHQITGSWEFLSASHGVILAVPDLTPNLGLFWYFFTETFEHFRVFFLCVFQINAFIYVLPLTIRFSDQPMFLTYILLSLMALFKSYPCVGDIALPLALLPLWDHTFRYLRYTLVVLVMFLLSTVLCPVLWFLWIHAGSANANFFFAMTITYALAQIFLVADVIYSFLVHSYDLRNGLPRLDKMGNKVKALKLT